MNLDDHAVQRHRLEPDAHNLFLLQVFEDPIQYAVLRTSTHSRVDGVPIAEMAGNPRHLQPCSATYRIALSTCWFDRLTLPR